MRRFLKPALIVLLICSCLTAKGQEKEFREAINKGKGVTGYYRADLSASHITLKKLTDYALKMKYVLRNPRLGSGRQEKYVVSVNFLPNTELSSKEAVLCGLSEADDGTYWVGADWWLLACWLFNDIAESRGESLAEMALAWILHQKAVTSVLVGASSTSQLEKNLKCVNAAPFDEAL